MSRFLNEKYQGLEAYTPGEQPQDMIYIKLNTNESPYPPSPSVLQSIGQGQLEQLRLYSDPESTRLRNKLAAAYGVGPKQVYVANGSDDILHFAFMAFGNPKTGVAFPAISYGFYKVFADLHQLPGFPIPLKADFSIDVQDYLGLKQLIVIANPNAPTGLVLSLAEIEEILKTNRHNVVVIDEAYIDFGGESCCSFIGQYENLLVVQTFSKSRSMAGARLGFALGNQALIEDLERLKYATNPYNINRLTLLAGEAAIEDQAYYREKCRLIAQTREYTADRLRQLGFTVLPSKANFLFACHENISGQTLYQELKQRGILIRHFSTPAIEAYNRITIGTRAQMEQFLLQTAELLAQRPAAFPPIAASNFARNAATLSICNQ
ncbi:histidinol-phosphate transaminase [Aminipila butyrica]|uniref:Histidinol-phosphate aminotransferase n=1 Tax=Aminipila butyrica TaxID=433296 RepID=A0A858BY33_9FIRM|nr:histidinol-phosphate transaminase [Aminipila butyrica]QIB70025.1 histidinol-phosphate transaminase [Aminipila butyrica]